MIPFAISLAPRLGFVFKLTVKIGIICGIAIADNSVGRGSIGDSISSALTPTFKLGRLVKRSSNQRLSAAKPCKGLLDGRPDLSDDKLTYHFLESESL